MGTFSVPSSAAMPLSVALQDFVLIILLFILQTPPPTPPLEGRGESPVFL
jgi:hypothetical protein